MDGRVGTVVTIVTKPIRLLSDSPLAEAWKQIWLTQHGGPRGTSWEKIPIVDLT